MINEEVFENELPFAVLKRPATVRAFNLTVGRRGISFDTPAGVAGPLGRKSQFFGAK
jgi:hypothetical protein